MSQGQRDMFSCAILAPRWRPLSWVICRVPRSHTFFSSCWGTETRAIYTSYPFRWRWGSRSQSRPDFLQFHRAHSSSAHSLVLPAPAPHPPISSLSTTVSSSSRSSSEGICRYISSPNLIIVAAIVVVQTGMFMTEEKDRSLYPRLGSGYLSTHTARVYPD